MHFESNREPYAGSADVLVRNAPTSAVFVRKRRSFRAFALRADEDVRAPGGMRLPNSQIASVTPASGAVGGNEPAFPKLSSPDARAL